MTTPGTTIRIVEEMTGDSHTLRTKAGPEIAIHKLAWQAIRYLFPSENWQEDFGIEDCDHDGDTLLCNPDHPPCHLAAAMHIYEDGTVLIRFHAIGDSLLAERALLNLDL